MASSRNLGRYQLVAELARGGMGLVYLAISSGVGGFSKLLVIKELKPELAEEAGFVEMFLEEARLAAQLSHPNIVTTYEVGIDGARPFMVMDYLEGQTLARVLKRCAEKLTRPMLLRVLVAALDGLHYAHTRQTLDGSTAAIVHRDVSPQNIFVTYDGQVKVVDFGIAKAADTTIETRAGTFKGKPSYMAPEQLRGDPDARADLFSVGVILWESLAGRRMWPRMNDVTVLTALLKGEIPSIDEVAPDAPAELRRICTKAVAADADARYESARALAADLNEYLAKEADRTNLADVGALLETTFADERLKIRRLVEKAVNDSKSIEAEAEVRLPSIAPPPDEKSQPSRPQRSDVAAPLSATPPSITQTPAGAAVAVEPPKPAARSKTGLVLVALAAIVGILFLLRGKLLTPPSTATTQPPPERAMTATPAPTVTPSAAAVVVPPTPEPSSSAAAVVTKPPVSTPARPVYTHAPPAPKPAPSPVVSAPPAAAAKSDCNPPYYFEGTKKVFKPGCL